jgi:uncharacterized membrane protein YoaK (UPF0700 family)
MGLQNSVHRFVPGPMTTVMTGNVTQLTALVGHAVFGREPTGAKKPTGASKPAGTASPWTPTVVLLLGFAAGCVASGLATLVLGLATSLACGVIVLAVVVIEARTRSGEAP